MNNINEEDDHNIMIKNFTELCCVDRTSAQIFLHKYRWNFERAVQKFYQNNGVPDSDTDTEETALRHRRPNSTNVETENRRQSNVETPTPSDNTAVAPQNRTISFFSFIISSPRFIFSIISWIYEFVKSLFFSTPLAVTNPLGDVDLFIKEFSEKYDRTRTVPFINNTYNEAVKISRNELKFLLIYLHSPSHQSTDTFCKNVLTNEIFIKYLKDNNILLWGASVKTSEGYKVAMALRENVFPYLGVIAMKEQKMVLVQRITGVLDVSEVINFLEFGIERNKRFFEIAKMEKIQREREVQLRKDQEREYQRTLAADRAKKNERERKETEKAERERKEKEAQEKELSKQKRLEAKINEIRNIIPEEPEKDAQNIVTVNIRYPNGNSFTHRFYEDDSLEKLFYAALIHEECPKDFTLICSYPRSAITCAPEWYREFSTCQTFMKEDREILTFKQKGYIKSLGILVNDNDA
uniref:UBX domain-containing protein n=1 Tax=Parastrongyloides trichosuri TaxID=131310 RepID=A0A0N4ZKL0_PARTI